MIRVLIIANDESTILNFRLEILEAFAKQNYKVLVCYPLGNNTEEIQKRGCEVKNLSVSRHGKNIIKDLKLISDCKRIIAQFAPDIVLTYTVKPNIYGSLACQMRKVRYINNVTGLGTVLQNGGVLAKLILGLQKIAYKKSSCVFFQNADNFQKLKSFGVVSEQTPVSILPGSGVNLQKQSFERYPEDDGVTRFLMVSRIRYDKGYKEYFDAAEVIKREYPNTEFHVIGWYEEEELSQRLNELIKKDIIIYHGKKLQEEVHEILAGCGCLVHPSYHEGMANVLLEAAACGRPVIASRIPGCREAFEENLTGYGCDARSSKSLEDAIIHFIRTPYVQRVEMGKQGRRKMEAEFDRKIVVKKYIDYIETIVRS